MKYRGAIFDLDGVLVDTARFHYLAWKELAEKLGFEFAPDQNEQLKGVSRAESLRLLLRSGGMEERFTEEEKARMSEWKNERYIQFVIRMEASDLLDGAEALLKTLKKSGIRTALGSASKNAPLVLQRTGIGPLFDTVVDGNLVTRAKLDPQVFLLGASGIGLNPSECAVFEDSASGLEAAKRAGMLAIGIGSHKTLGMADVVFPNLAAFEPDLFFELNDKSSRGDK